MQLIVGTMFYGVLQSPLNSETDTEKQACSLFKIMYIHM